MSVIRITVEIRGDVGDRAAHIGYVVDAALTAGAKVTIEEVQAIARFDVPPGFEAPAGSRR